MRKKCPLRTQKANKVCCFERNIANEASKHARSCPALSPILTKQHSPPNNSKIVDKTRLQLPTTCKLLFAPSANGMLAELAETTEYDGDDESCDNKSWKNIMRRKHERRSYNWVMSLFSVQARYVYLLN